MQASARDLGDDITQFVGRRTGKPSVVEIRLSDLSRALAAIFGHHPHRLAVRESGAYTPANHTSHVVRVNRSGMLRRKDGFALANKPSGPPRPRRQRDQRVHPPTPTTDNSLEHSLTQSAQNRPYSWQPDAARCQEDARSGPAYDPLLDGEGGHEDG
ncbi:hypothetical protein L1887_62999 [Cichorium endivia]|nr:hypothetical protein L1887_62999 [Cichorium endivia]